MRYRSFAVLLVGTMLVSVQTRAACPDCETARTLLHAGKAEQALKLMKKAVSADKSDVEPRGLLAMAYLGVSKRPAAADALKEFLERSPGPSAIAEVAAALHEAPGEEPAPRVRFETPDGADPPRLVYFTRATPPETMREAGVQGDVPLVAIVGVNGKATAIELVADSAMRSYLMESDLYDSATNCLRRWQFIPALRDGVPVPAKLQVAISFRLLR
ncbi:MAG: energy transducer TonB [Acidobacteriia bacterium]|nr:energy transducer TonB [Terriglobia bacterium]